MRKILLLLLVALLSSCYIMNDSSFNTLDIDLTPRNIQSQYETDVLRVYVTSGQHIVPLSEYGFIEFQISDSTSQVEVGPIAEAEGYRVILSFGNYEGNIFVPEEYAFSSEFGVRAGQLNLVDVSFFNTVYSFVDKANTFGLNLIDVEYQSSILYSATSNRLITLDPFSSTNFEGTINSLSLGSNSIWINTSTGLFDQNFDAIGSLSDVVNSGGFYIEGTIYGYTQHPGSFSGFYNDGSVENWLLNVDLTGFSTGEPIYNMTVTETTDNISAYFTSKIGPFRATGTVLQGEYETTQDILNVLEFFDVYIDGSKTIATYIAAEKYLPNKLIIGTPRGTMMVNESDIDTGSVSGSSIPETRGKRSIRIETDLNNIVIQIDHFLLLSSDGGSSFRSIPIYSLPLNIITGLVIVGDSLFVSGDNGLIEIGL